MSEVEKLVAEFKKKSIDCMEFVVGQVKAVGDAELVEIDDDIADGIVVAVEVVPKDDMIKMFCKKSEYWDKAIKKDMDFLTKEVPKVFSDIDVDLDLLTAPFKIFLELKEGKYSTQYESKDEWPLEQEDIDICWTKFQQLIVLAYDYCVLTNYKDVSQYKTFVETLKSKKRK